MDDGKGHTRVPGGVHQLGLDCDQLFPYLSVTCGRVELRERSERQVNRGNVHAVRLCESGNLLCFVRVIQCFEERLRLTGRQLDFMNAVFSHFLKIPCIHPSDTERYGKGPCFAVSHIHTSY